MSYQAVTDALNAGLSPEAICATCPWNRTCIEPPTMTRQQIDEMQAKAEREERERADERRANGEKANDFPIGSLLTTLMFAGKDTSAQLCPALAVQMQTDIGEQIVRSVKQTMQSYATEDAS